MYFNFKSDILKIVVFSGLQNCLKYNIVWIKMQLHVHANYI